MNTNDLNTALYEKMAAEQDKYRDWLKSQPPEEILHHTYEYTSWIRPHRWPMCTVTLRSWRPATWM